MITQKDIAKEAKVTVPTVSRALSGDKEIAQATREQITEIAFRLGYKPRRGVSENARIMGVIIPDMSSGFFTDILADIDQVLSELGYIPLYAPYDFDDDSYMRAFELCKKWNTVGILAISLIDRMAGFVRRFTTVNAIPVVMLMHQVGNAYDFLDGVSVDLTGALTEAISLWKKNGHKKIGLMTDTINYKARGQEFAAAFRDNGFEEGMYPVFLSEERFEEGGYLCMKKMLKRGRYPSALIVGYDHFAIGACKAVREAGIRIPEDIALCGIDNLSMDAYINPALSSIATPVREMIRTAMDYMKKLLHDDGSKPIYKTTLYGKLFVRESML